MARVEQFLPPALLGAHASHPPFGPPCLRGLLLQGLGLTFCRFEGLLRLPPLDECNRRHGCDQRRSARDDRNPDPALPPRGSLKLGAGPAHKVDRFLVEPEVTHVRLDPVEQGAALNQRSACAVFGEPSLDKRFQLKALVVERGEPAANRLREPVMPQLVVLGIALAEDASGNEFMQQLLNRCLTLAWIGSNYR